MSWHQTPVFIAALFTIAKMWKQLKCPLKDEWMSKLQYIHTMEYYSYLKRKEFCYKMDKT